MPLIQSRQNFCAMDMVLRQEFHSMIEKMAEKYNLDQLVFASFILQHGFRNKFCASDVVYSMLALLESTVSNTCIQFLLFNYEQIFVSLGKPC